MRTSPKNPTPCTTSGCDNIQMATKDVCKRCRSRQLRGSSKTFDQSKSKGEAQETHGMCYSSEYQSWGDAKQRCYNPTNARYNQYGGKGISMWRGWITDFPAFMHHIGKKPNKEASLDRIDTSGNYEPGNVRWATRQQQYLSRTTTKVTAEVYDRVLYSKYVEGKLNAQIEQEENLAAGTCSRLCNEKTCRGLLPQLKNRDLKALREKLHKAQGGRCPISGKKFTRKIPGHIDHWHRRDGGTGVVRALLMPGANRFEGIVSKGARWMGNSNPLVAVTALKRYYEIYGEGSPYIEPLAYPAKPKRRKKRIPK